MPEQSVQELFSRRSTHVQKGHNALDKIILPHNASVLRLYTCMVAPLLDVLSIVTDEGNIDANRSTAQRPSTDHVFMHGRAHLTEDLADLPVCLSPKKYHKLVTRYEYLCTNSRTKYCRELLGCLNKRASGRIRYLQHVDQP